MTLIDLARDEAVIVGGCAVLTVTEIRRTKVYLGIEAPKSVRVVRVASETRKQDPKPEEA